MFCREIQGFLFNSFSDLILLKLREFALHNHTQGCKVKRTFYGVFQDPLTKSSLAKVPNIAKRVLKRKYTSKSTYIGINVRWNYQLKQLDKQTKIKKLYPLNMKIKNPLHTKWLDNN